jgi:NitT/TauT family transport system substrate-binding protein
MAAIKYTMTNFEDSLAIFLKANDEVAMSKTGKEYSRLGLGLTIATNLVPEVKEHGLGYADPGKVKDQAEIIVKYGAGTDAKMPDVDTLFTNRFAGKMKLTQSELEASEKAAAPFKKHLG